MFAGREGLWKYVEGGVMLEVCLPSSDEPIAWKGLVENCLLVERLWYDAVAL